MDVIFLIILLGIFLMILIEIAITQRNILSELEKIEEQTQKEKTKVIRKHDNMPNTNYNSILASRGETKGYEVFKNKNGLYEPVKPHGGIIIEKED